MSGTASQPIGQMCELQIIPHRLSIDSFPAADIDHYSVALMRILFDKLWRDQHEDKFISFTITPNGECSVIMDVKCRQCFIDSRCPQMQSSGAFWRAVRVELGHLGANYSQSFLTAALSAPLAAHGISIYYCSTFGSEMFMVKEEDMQRAVEILERELGVVARHDDTMNKTIQEEEGWFLTPPPNTSSDVVRHPVSRVRYFPKEALNCMQLHKDELPIAAHALLNLMFFGANRQFISIVETPDEISLFLRHTDIGHFPERCLQSGGSSWKPIMVDEGDLGFAMCGIVNGMTNPLSKYDITVFYLSVFSTDFCFVPESDVDQSLNILKEAGFRIIQ